MLPELVAEVDFQGLPTATNLDTLTNAEGARSYRRMSSTSALTDALGLNSGTYPAAPSLVTGALPNDTDQALLFDGTNDYATVPTSASLTEAGSYTLSGWVRFPSLPSAVKPVWTKGAFRLETTAANKLLFSVQNHVNNVSIRTTVTSNTTLVANTWYHVAAVHDATLNQLRLHTDGVLENTVSHTVGTELWSLPLLFAAQHSGTAPSFGSVGTAYISAVVDPWLVDAPASIAAGDVLVCHAIVGGSATMTPPAGWSVWATTLDATNGWRSYLFSKVAVAGDVGAVDYTFDLSAAAAGSAVITRFTGVDGGVLLANPPYVNAQTAGGTSFTTGSKWPQADDVLVVAAYSVSRAVNFASTDGTERYDTSSSGAGGPGNGLAMYTTLVTNGAQTAVAATASASVLASHAVHAYWLALKGADAQNFTNVQLDDWTFHNTAFDANTVQAHYQSRLAGVGAWTELVSSGQKDTRGVSLKYGRQYELNRMEAGSATVTVKNQHRKYDPANTESPHYPNVKTNRKIRFRALLSGVYYPLFEGFVERWPSNWDVPNYDEMTLTVADGFKALNRAGVSTILDSGLSGLQIATIANRALWPADKRALDDGLFVMAADATVGTAQALGVIQDIADSELGIVFVDHTAGSPLTFHDRGHRWRESRSITSQATFSDQMTHISYHGLDPSLDDDNMVNEWNVTTATGFSGSAMDIVSRADNFPVTQSRSTRLDAPADAAAQALGLLQQTSKPTLRFDALVLKLTANTPLAVWQEALTLAISDRVTVKANPVPNANGSLISEDCFIEGINWTITPVLWQVSYQLSPVATASYYDTITLDAPVSYWRMG
jgi:hypothetical protein